MDLWKKPALKLIVEVVWTADCVNQTQPQASNALTRTRTRSTHAPLSANHCSLLLITPCGLIHSIYRFRFPRRVVFIFSLRVQSLIWFVKSLPLSVFKFWLDYLIICDWKNLCSRTYKFQFLASKSVRKNSVLFCIATE